VPSPPAHAVRQLRQSGRQGVWLVHRPGEEPRTVKRWALTPWCLVKLLLGIAQPQRQIRGARRLARAGIPTPQVLGRWRFVRRRPAVQLELAWIEGDNALERMRCASPAPGDVRRLSAALGRTVAAMSAAALFNRDLKLDNLIVDRRETLWQIDTVGVRWRRRRVRETARMLERLAAQLPVTGVPLVPAVWLPALRHALRGLPRASRPAAVRWLRAHRPP
jgi:hypothetical protein